MQQVQPLAAPLQELTEGHPRCRSSASAGWQLLAAHPEASHLAACSNRYKMSHAELHVWWAAA